MRVESTSVRGESVWKTLPAYQNREILQTPAKGLIQYPSSFIFYIFGITETYRVTASKMLIILRKNGGI